MRRKRIRFFKPSGWQRSSKDAREVPGSTGPINIPRGANLFVRGRRASIPARFFRRTRFARHSEPACLSSCNAFQPNYLSSGAVPSIDSPARHTQPSSSSSRGSSVNGEQRRRASVWTELQGVLECSEHNPLCRGDCVYVCMRFQVEWNFYEPLLRAPRLNNSQITSAVSRSSF